MNTTKHNSTRNRTARSLPPPTASRSLALALLCALITLTLATPPTSAQTQTQSKRQQARVDKIFANWDTTLARADQALTKGDAKQTVRLVSIILSEATDQVISGNRVDRLLGTALVLKALAAHKLGDVDQALWFWHSALAVWPAAAQLSMSAYGDSGPFLKSQPPRTPATAEQVIEQGVQFVKGSIAKPVKLKGPMPGFPRALRGRDAGAVVISTVLNVDGRPTQPVLVSNTGPTTLVCATLVRLHEWRFKPATKDGAPVPVFFNLTMNFNSR